MFKKLLMVICVCFVVFLAGCKGDDGAVGPAGPAGVAGATGATGATGAAGTGSSAIILTTGAVTGAGTSGDLSFAILDDLTASEQALYDSSVVVLVYAKSLGAWWPLPGIVQFTGNAVSSFTFVHGVDATTFFVDIFNTGYSEDVAAAPVRSFDDIRVVLIPGSTSKLSAEVNWNSYDDAVKALGITDASVRKANVFKKK